MRVVLQCLGVAATLLCACGPGLEEGRPDQGHPDQRLIDQGHDVAAADAPVPDQGWPCREFFTNTYQHVAQGRAHLCEGYACANGSNDNLGLYNTFNEVYLREVASGYFELGRCP